MTIQISVLIWTIICFCVLMLVLDRLLFRPVLGFMHERRRRIEEEQARRSAEEQKAAEEKAAQEAAALDEKQNKNQHHNVVLAQAYADAEHIVAEKKVLVREQLEQDLHGMEEHRADLIRQLDEKLPELAIQLADRLTVWENKD